MKCLNFKTLYYQGEKDTQFNEFLVFGGYNEINVSEAVPHICPICNLPVKLNHCNRLATFWGFCENGDFMHVAKYFEPMVYNTLMARARNEKDTE